MSTGAPQSASTVGKSDVGLTAYAEAPTVDLQASNDATGGRDYDYSPLPTMSVEAAYGLTENLDLELSLDGVLYFLLPLPLGGSIGLRQQLWQHPKLAIALSAKVGYVQLGQSDSDSELAEDYSAIYGKATAVAQYNPQGSLRPGLALTLSPASVDIDPADSGNSRFDARSATISGILTIAFDDVEFGPFVNLVYFDSAQLLGSTVFYTGGFMVALRPQRTAETL